MIYFRVITTVIFKSDGSGYILGVTYNLVIVTINICLSCPIVHHWRLLCTASTVTFGLSLVKWLKWWAWNLWLLRFISYNYWAFFTRWICISPFNSLPGLVRYSLRPKIQGVTIFIQILKYKTSSIYLFSKRVLEHMREIIKYVL